MTSQQKHTSEHLSVQAYDYSLFGKVKTVPMDKIRQIIGRRMAASWQNVPHVTHHDEVDISDLETLRHQHNEKAKSGSRLSTLSFIVKACLAGLKEHPDFNSSLDETGEKLFIKEYFNIGIAVDTLGGLLVPVLKNADKLSLEEIASSAGSLAEKARTGKLSFADAEGGTFTVTSLGKIGGTAFTPIINAPEVAIMGVSRARQKPIEFEGQIALRLMLPLSLSYDHRVIDGAMAARFMGVVRDRLFAPESLL
ncbi:2-oxo acid dehydrogenase subunit E2 [Planktotalea arctica]|uniref:2-oxo acid dehydrogenase subunit E2 n=1 Tax=Planktotalea arctica TaxID=1481893 RepID=UPI0015948465|nr:2-oxo acid dehydrogenase subunit E2 [Planktotalea arctica]